MHVSESGSIASYRGPFSPVDWYSPAFGTLLPEPFPPPDVGWRAFKRSSASRILVWSSSSSRLWIIICCFLEAAVSASRPAILAQPRQAEQISLLAIYVLGDLINIRIQRKGAVEHRGKGLSHGPAASWSMPKFSYTWYHRREDERLRATAWLPTLFCIRHIGRLMREDDQ